VTREHRRNPHSSQRGLEWATRPQPEKGGSARRKRTTRQVITAIVSTKDSTGETASIVGRVSGAILTAISAKAAVAAPKATRSANNGDLHVIEAQQKTTNAKPKTVNGSCGNLSYFTTLSHDEMVPYEKNSNVPTV
jgi:hypothetical protein